MTHPRPLPAMRVRLAPEYRIKNDPLGRTHGGYKPGLKTAELWNRARGPWKANPNRILAAELLLVTFEDTVQLVVDIRGVLKHGGALEILGDPLPQHWLTGEVDPLHNTSLNPVTYGDIPASDGP